MLKEIGNIFKSDLPDNTSLGTVIPTNTNNTTPQNFFGFSFNKILSNYTRYEKNANVFRTFIQVDVVKAKELDLSYFKTITINKFQNSKYSNLELGYIKLLNENQKIDLKNFILNDSLDRNFDLIRNDILGRELNLNEMHNKSSVENFASRKAFNYNSGLTVNADLDISEYQDLFFELAFASDTRNSILSSFLPQFQSLQNMTKYDLIIYAMNSNDEIIDVKKIEDFNTADIRWNVNTTTLLYNIDDVDFDKLFNMTFDTVTFNNLRRKFYINTTQYCKDIKEQLGFFPIETISIQENSNPIEIQLDKINVSNVFINSDKIELNCNTDLTLSDVPINIEYKLFMKIIGSNSYVIKTFRNTITDSSALNLMTQRQKFPDLLNHTHIQYLTNVDQSRSIIKVNLSLLKTAFNDPNFNPTISSIFINDDVIKDYSIEIFTFIPSYDSFPNLNLQGNLLKEVVTTSTNATENILTFYFRNKTSNPLTLTFVFEQDFERYEISFPVETIYETSDYEQNLTITNNNLINRNFSNLNIEYLIKIKNFKNSSINLNRFLTLNYESVFLAELQEGKNKLTQDFENNIFVLIKKSIYQESIHVKDKYYIFNKDIRNSNIITLELQTENDLNLKLDFIDSNQINNFFFKENKYYDNVDITKNIKYKFEARIMIIPLGFFILNSDYITKQRIKELLCLNNFQKALPSDNKIEEIFQILKKINENTFNDLNQLYLHKLYNDFCLKDTQASNEIVITATNLNSAPSNNILSFNNISYQLMLETNRQKTLNFSLKFDILSKNVDNTTLISILNKLQLTTLFSSFFFKDNNTYINTSQIITELSIATLIRSLNTNLSYTFNINTDSAEIIISLPISADLLRFFNFAKIRSTLEFSPYTFDFLNRNLYLRLDLPVSLNDNANTIQFFNINENNNQYLLLDFYPFLN